MGDHLLIAERAGGLGVLATPLDGEPVLVNRLAERAVHALSADGPLAVALGEAWPWPESWIHTLDVSDPAHPAFLGTLGGFGRLEWITLRGSLAAAGGESLLLVDVSDPAAPEELAALPFPARSVRGDFAGSLLYVTTERGFYSVDVRDPTNPRVRGGVPTDEGRGFEILPSAVLCLEGGKLSVLPRDCAPFTIGAAPAPEPPYGLVTARPNPFRTATFIRFPGPAARPAEIDVFDASGRRIRTRLPVDRTSGTAVWNGRGDDGRPVAAGVYFVRLRLGSAAVTHKVTRLR